MARRMSLRENAASVSMASTLLLLLHALNTPDPDTKVTAAVVTWYVLCQLQWILGPMRRCSGHWFVQYGAMAAYYLPVPLLFYAARVVYSSASEYGLNMISGSMFIFVTLDGGRFMNRYRLSESSTPGWRLFASVGCIAWLKWSMWRGWFSLLSWLCGTLYMLMIHRVPGAMFAYEVQAFSDHMKLESRSRSPFFDGDSNENILQGCKYPFMMDGNRCITIKDVLTRNCSLDVDDILLSYSLSRLLARHYFEFHCAEEGDAKVRYFALTELLQGQDHNRAFNIVEVQLAFLHDCFFISYYSDMNAGLLSAEQGQLIALKCLAGIMVITVCAYGLMSLSCFMGLWVSRQNCFLMAGYGELVFIIIAGGAGVFLCALTFIPQVYTGLPTHWLPIKHARLFNQTAPTDQVLSFSNIDSCSQSSTSRIREYYWRNKMGQYSVIEDYDHRSVKKTCIAWFKQNMLSQVSRTAPFIKHHPMQEEEVSVPDSMRISVALALRDMNGPPTNGTRALQRNIDRIQVDLTWTCTPSPSVASHTHTILIWHIATCYCDMSQLESERIYWSPSYEVATKLSRYCAYLVAFAPDLLPESSFQTTITLQKVLQEAQGLLGRKRMSTMEAKWRSIRGIQVPAEVDAIQTTFEKGIRLGQQLSSLNNDDDLLGWKVMEEFWVETILCVAPSDNAAAHIDQLANGGEFVTHLWALLSNAGILKRATQEWSPPQPAPVVPNSVTEQKQEEQRVAPSSSAAATRPEPVFSHSTN